MTFWDIVAPMYDLFERFNKPYKLMLDKINELVPQGANALELAGGTGNVSLAVSKKAFKVLCTDISESMLKTAKRKAKRRGIDNIDFDKISIFKTGKQNKSFDVVIASQILHLLAEPEKACNEIKRITDGMAFLIIPLLKELTPFGKFLIDMYKIVGFKPKHELDTESCNIFLNSIGFENCTYYVIKGTVSLYVGIWMADKEKSVYG
jgi:ubiquinone/menaquinone biosynthesis C-methylase UbiE